MLVTFPDFGPRNEACLFHLQLSKVTRENPEPVEVKLQELELDSLLFTRISHASFVAVQLVTT